MFLRKNKKYQMDMDAANTALQNIFAACDKAPNTIPFDKLILRQNANTKPYNLLMAITAVLLFLTFISPLLIVPAATFAENIFAPEPVKLVNDYVRDDILYLEFTGDNILFDRAYMETENGEQTPALSYDADKGLICFPYDATQETNIFIIAEDEEPYHFLLSPKP